MIGRRLHSQIGMRREEHQQPRSGEEIGHAAIVSDALCLALERSPYQILLTSGSGGTRMGIEEKAGHMGIVTTSLEYVVNWGRTNAMWPLLFGLACCAIEMMAAQAANYDMARFGMEINRASPRQADLMIVAGRVSRKMAPVVRRLYDQMSDPKWVVAMGDCAACGGVFNNYAIVQGVDEIIPVDVYVAGCPPRPEALIDGMLLLHEQVKRMKLTGEVREREPIHV